MEHVTLAALLLCNMLYRGGFGTRWHVGCNYLFRGDNENNSFRDLEKKEDTGLPVIDRKESPADTGYEKKQEKELLHTRANDRKKPRNSGVFFASIVTGSPPAGPQDQND